MLTVLRSTLLYLALAVLSLLLTHINADAIYIWLADAWALAHLMTEPARQRLAKLAGFFGAGVAARWAMGDVTAVAVFYSAVHVLQVAAILMVAQRFISFPLNRHVLVEKVLYILFASSVLFIPLAAVCAAGMAAGANRAEFSEALGSYWLSGVTGQCLLFIPTLLADRQRWQEWRQPRRALEVVGWFLTILASSWIILDTLTFPYIYVVIPLAFMAVRLGGFFTALVSLLVIVCEAIMLLVFGASLSAFSDVNAAQSIWATSAMTVVLASLLGVLRDNMKERSRRLSESENRIRAALDYSATGFAVCNISGEILEINPYLCSLIGVRSAQLIGKPFAGLVVSDGHDELQHALSQLQNNASHYVPVRWRLNACGGQRWAKGRVSLLQANQEILIQLEDMSDSVASQQHIKHLKERFELAQRSMKLGVWDFDLHTNELVWDEFMYHLYGVDDCGQKLDYEFWRSFVLPDDLLATEAHLQHCLATGTDFDSEFRIVLRDGSVRTLHANSLTLFDAGGTAVRMVGVNWDVTERSRAERKLMEQDHRLQLALDTVNAGAWEWQVDTNVGWWAESIYRMFGVREMSLSPTHELWLQSIHPEDRDQAQETVMQAVAAKKSYRMEYRVLWPDGQIRWIVDSANVELDSQGKVFRLFGVNIDVTASKQIELALLSARAQLQGVINAATQVSIIATDLSGTITLFNTGAERMLGYRGDMVVDKLTPAVFHRPEEFAERSRRLERELGYPIRGMEVLTARARTEGGSDVNEWTYVRSDGQLLAVVVATTGIFDASGQLTGYLSIANDISSLKQTQKELLAARDQAESANRAKSLFLANMSHEIRTPLNAVLGMAQLMMNSPVNDEQKEALQMIAASGQALLAILNDILDFSKIEAERLELAPSHVDLDEVIDTVASVMSINSADKHLELLIEVQPTVPGKVFCDGLRLKQVLMNLCSNAIKFTLEGEVCLSLSFDMDHSGKSWLVCTVRDTGIGMTVAQQKRLFVPFNQADNSMTRRFGGTGLGLVISKRLVELMGGSLTFTSEADKGSCFTVRLPVVFAEPCKASGEARRLLLLSPCPLLASSLGSVSQRLGWRMERHGLEALETIEQRIDPLDYDTLLIDSRFAVDRVADCLQRLPELKQLPVIVLSRAGRHWSGEEVLAFSQCYNLYSPITPNKLRHALRSALLRGASAGMSPEQGSELQLPRPEAEMKLEASPGTEPAHAYAGAGTEPVRRAARCLLVEDNVVNQKVASRLLARLGVEVDIAQHGQEAVDRLQLPGADFDVILMDVQMPVMDGFTATRTIRRQLQLNIPIIALTAGVLESERQQCMACGMDDFLPKPVSLTMLYQSLQKLLPGRIAEVQVKPLFNATGGEREVS
ncbi:PAS domain S-box protein [Pokkaliibacter sp. MBI-7]|uniref:PAS domain S-box protein n=1 Tax=Pokkaliibacter sp. MBI-7 TaxID=3040600 RepID=UPI00244B0C40|nr:PAS domain S-box protein [Pokkaliibacter sp. MBI-7]MDH2436283.1 PAS domain S-box protein [Pokkaliibacter sp. MBI-7]